MSQLSSRNKKIKSKVKQIAREFMESRDAALFKAKGIANEISVKSGELKKWKGLHHSIMASGLILLGRYEAKELPSGTKHEIIFSWEKVEKNRGAFLNKLYGFTVRGKRYSGLLKKVEGRKVGKSSIILPMKYKDDIIALFRKYKVHAKQIEVFTVS